MAERLQVEQLYDKFLVSSGVNTDTRTIEYDQFFVALKGPNFNANEYADEALEKGALYAVVDDEKYATTEQHLLVNDSLTALQELANFHRRMLQVPILALTGSNGKTTTKELIAAVLQTNFMTYATKGNLNNHIGVPLSLLSITPQHDIAIIEMGANHLGEIASLCRIAQPDFGLITNIGTAHIEGFGSKENVRKAKGELFDYLATTEHKTVFVNADDSLLMVMSEHLERIEYGKEGKFIQGELFQDSNYLRLTIQDSEQEFTITTQLVGAYNFYNALAAAAVGRHFGVPLLDIAEAIEQYTPTNHRSQLIKQGNNTFIVDAYNANPSSMMASLKHFVTQPGENKLAILGSMLELGDIAAREHQTIADFLHEYQLNALLVGQEFKYAAQTHHIPWVNTVSEAKVWFKKQAIQQTTILLKGSRGIQLEQLLTE